MVGGSCQCVFIGSTIDVVAHQLFGSGICHSANGHVRGRKPADVIYVASNAEVGQQDPLLSFVVGMREHDVRRFNVAMEQALVMGVVKRARHSGDNVHDLVDRHSGGVSVGKKPSGVHTVDVIHRNPELPLVLTSVVDTNDMWVIQRGR